MPTDPYRIDGPWPGRLAISARPRGGDWLEDEITNWRESGFDTVVSLLVPEEIQEMDLQQEPGYCRANRIEFISFPIVDRNVPASQTDTVRLLKRLDAELSAGKGVNVHCRQGIGRSALIATGLLVSKGISLAEAIKRITMARHCAVPETAEQRAWLDSFAAALTTASPLRGRES